MRKKNTAVGWIVQNSKQMLPGILTLTMLGMLGSLVSVHFASLSKELMDIATRQTEGNLNAQILEFVCFILLLLVLQVLTAIIDVRVVGKLNISFKRRLFGDLLYKDLNELSYYHSGELLNRLTSDISLMTKTTAELIPTMFSLLARVVYASYLLFLYDKMFAGILLVGGLLLMLLTRLYGKKMKQLHKLCQQSDGKTRSFMQEVLQNLLAIKSFRNENEVLDYSTGLQQNNFVLTLKRNHISIFANIAFFVAMTAVYYFALAWGAYKVALGLMSYGTVFGLMQLVGQVQNPFRSLSGLVPQYYSMLASAERIMELQQLPDDLPAEGDPVCYDQMEGFCADNLSFSYGEECVFRDANWQMKKGDFVAITGSSGIGKSTLLKLMLGILSPNQGGVFAFDASGEKIPLTASTRHLFAYVPQRNLILSGTIRDNIVFFKPDITEEQIIRAAKGAEIWDFINSAPNGLDTMVGENGVGLSEGQAQRVAIARALLHDAPVLLLDEATSALDEATEQAVLRNIRALETKSCIIVSHKKTALDFCDFNIMIKDQQIVSSKL